MPNSTQEEKYRWIKPILDKEISIKNMAKVCPFSERAIKYWLAAFRKYGVDGLENKSTRPKSNPRETPIRIKEKIIELRKETKKCALKLKWDLKEENISIHERTVGKIIKREGLTRRYRIRRIKYKYIKAQLRQGELIEIDIKYVPRRVKNRRYYQFTAIDCATRWRYLKIYDDCSSFNALKFLRELIKIAPFEIRAIKTDNDSCFTNRHNGGYIRSIALFPKEHAFDGLCSGHSIIHYLIDPGKPQQNGTVERSHRSDQESFYDRIKFESEEELKYQLRLWNMHYNDLKHCGLNGLTPNQALRFEVQNVRT